MDTRLLLRSIALAAGLTIGLGVIFAVAILLANRAANDDGTTGGGTGGGTSNTACQFTGASAILTVYQAPVTDATQEKARVSGSEAYPVNQTRDQYALIQLRDGRTAWADKRDGKLAGNCKNVPVDDTPLTGFPTLCTFTNTTSAPLYDRAAATAATGTVAPGTYALIGINQGRYYLFQDVNQGGWVLGSTGFIQGNCVMLPARPG